MPFFVCGVTSLAIIIIMTRLQERYSLHWVPVGLLVFLLVILTDVLIFNHIR